MEALVSLEGLPSRFLVAVYDYAMNVSTYGVELGDQQDDSRPYFTAINRTNLDDAYRLSWVGFGMEESTETVNLGPHRGGDPESSGIWWTAMCS